jgi:predicted chitinase
MANERPNPRIRKEEEASPAADGADTPPPGDRGEEAEEAFQDDLALAAEDSADLSGIASSGALQPTYTVSSRDGLNLRGGPGTEFPVIGSLGFGSRVVVVKREGAWALIDRERDGATDGYAHASFLREQAAAGPVGILGARGGGFVPLNRPLLQLIMDRCAKVHIRSKLDLDVVADALNRSMLLADADTRLREVAFLSQSVIETDYFRTFSEYGKGAGKAYRPYYGRGMHQLTWKDTYAKCSRALFGDDRLVRDPDLILKDIEVNIKATAWYWRDHKPFNRLADAEDIDEIIYRLYGGKITSPNPKVRRSVILRRGYYTTIKAILKEHDGT